MAKKKEIKEEEVTYGIAESVPRPKVQPLMNDLGRDDLNLLRDKINEIISII